MTSKLLSLLFGAAAIVAGGTANAYYAPAIGSSAGESILITVNADNSVSTTFTGVGPYDAIEDTLVAVLNLSSTVTLNSIAFSGANIFGFDGDGIAAYGFNFGGPTGYEGPNNTFTVLNANSGVVNFISALGQGQYTYFSLEEAPSAFDVNTVAINTNVPAVPEPETYAMLLAGLGLLGASVRRKQRNNAA